MNYTNKLRQLYSKLLNLHFENWSIYLLSSNNFISSIDNGKFNMESAKNLSFLKISRPDKKHIIAADPYFLTNNMLLFESISTTTGRGCIFSYDLISGEYNSLDLDPLHHYSFPRTFIIDSRTYLTLESHTQKGLSIYLIEDMNTLSIKRIYTNKYSAERDYTIIDPVILIDKESVRLLCTSIEGKDHVRHIFRSTKGLNQFNFTLEKNIYIVPNVNGIGKTMRSAGGLFTYRGCEYFPMQMRSKSYGDGIWLLDKSYNNSKISETNELVNFSSESRRIGPHTLNYSPNREILAIDSYTKDLALSYLKIKWFLKSIYN